MTSIALSRDGATLATCTAGVNQTFAEPVRIWDVRTGELKREFSEPLISGRPMALSPDGTVLATGGKSVRLWDARTGKLLRELFGHLKRTQSITFSADGRLLFSGGSYGTTNAWEVATGRHLVTLFAFPERRDGTVEEEWLAYHPDGYYDGSPGIDRLLAWRVGDELLTPGIAGPATPSPRSDCGCPGTPARGNRFALNRAHPGPGLPVSRPGFGIAFQDAGGLIEPVVKLSPMLGIGEHELPYCGSRRGRTASWADRLAGGLVVTGRRSRSR